MTPDQHSEGLSRMTGDLVPQPDPTRMTIEMLDREIRHFKEFHAADSLSLRERIDEHVQQLADLRNAQDKINDNRFRGIEVAAAGQREIRDLRFELIEKQRIELKTDNAKSFDSALMASKEALGNLAETYQTGHASLLITIDEMKNRLTTMESVRLSGKESSAKMIAVISVGLTVVYLVATVMLTLFVHH